MAAFRILISPRAAGELESIHDFVSESAPAAADRVLKRLWTAIQSLEDYPHRYAAYHGRRFAYQVRRMPVLPHMDYYRVDQRKGIVEIITVRHSKQRAPVDLP